MASSSRPGLLDKGWEQTQVKVFGRWVAKQLKQRGIDFEDVASDFSDGTKLINLMEILGKEPIGQKWTKAPKSKFQALENLTIALNYITQKKGIRLVGIGSNDIYDKNLKLTLGLTWTLILKYSIEEITVEEATARDALMIWAKKNTAEFEEVNITNFTTSWNSALAFCGLINHFRPNVLDYNALPKGDRLACATAAVNACKEIGLYVYMDPEDIAVDMPDEKSIVTQVAEYFHFFASDEKLKAMAEKLGRTVTIEQDIENLLSEYEKQAREAMDVMAEIRAYIVSEDYEKTIPGVKTRLSEVIKYAQTDRPRAVGKRTTAQSTWNSLMTKVKSNNRPLPVAPEGLAPEDLLATFGELEEIAVTQRKVLTEELNRIEQEVIDAFNTLCQGIADKNSTIRSASSHLEGTLQEQKVTLEDLLAQAEENLKACDTIDEPAQKLVEYGLTSRVNYSKFTVQSEAEEIVVIIKRLLEQNAVDIITEDNNRRIREYEELALGYYQEAQDFDNGAKSVQGDLAERRTALIEMRDEAPSKKEKVNVLNQPYTDLEKDNLTLGIENSPNAIISTYTGTQAFIMNELMKIYDEMVKTFNERAEEINHKIHNVEEKHKVLEGDLEPRKEGCEALLAEADTIDADIAATEEPYQELVQFRLHTRVKRTPNYLASFLDQIKAALKQNKQSLEEQITRRDNEKRVNEYQEQASPFVEFVKERESDVAAVDGTNEEKIPKLQAIDTNLINKENEIQNIEPIYEHLAADQLHLNIQDTPGAIRAFYENLHESIQKSIKEIDAAIAAAKGLQISDEQLAEFRDTFQHFDKDKSGTLQYYELKACLTALGDTSTDDECKDIIKKYSNGKTDMTFEQYAQFMLDRFSKEESPQATKDAFLALTGSNPIITDETIDRHFPPEAAEYLKKKLPKVEGGYDFIAWADSLYLNKE